MAWPVELKYAVASSGSEKSVATFHVKVANLGFAKEVVVRQESVAGEWYDSPLHWVANFGECDLFEGTGRYYVIHSHFAVRYTVNGFSYWDNHQGRNYLIDRGGGVVGAGGVSLEEAWVTWFHYPTGFGGSIIVSDASHNKDVGVCFSNDNWQTVRVAYATFQQEFLDYALHKCERWRFGFSATPPGQTQPSGFKPPEFAVFLHDRNTRLTSWDNNLGKNYSLLRWSRVR